eukprot:GHVQ01013343.1.p1 GENE.GHVQ01013343.1~~GHVQ01013343.1.p1  ORF type:complete len:524 (-),score=42.01 GHVQ01013343.1:2088-3659(-)
MGLSEVDNLQTTIPPTRGQYTLRRSKRALTNSQRLAPWSIRQDTDEDVGAPESAAIEEAAEVALLGDEEETVIESLRKEPGRILGAQSPRKPLQSLQRYKRRCNEDLLVTQDVELARTYSLRRTDTYHQQIYGRSVESSLNRRHMSMANRVLQWVENGPVHDGDSDSVEEVHLPLPQQSQAVLCLTDDDSDNRVRRTSVSFRRSSTAMKRCRAAGMKARTCSHLWDVPEPPQSAEPALSPTTSASPASFSEASAAVPDKSIGGKLRNLYRAIYRAPFYSSTPVALEKISSSALVIKLVGLCGGLDSFWRLPSLCSVYGNLSVAVAVCVLSVLLGLPVAVLEMSTGQMFQGGAVHSNDAISKRARGVGAGCLMANFCILLYTIVVVDFMCVYLWNSFSQVLPWACSAEHELTCKGFLTSLTCDSVNTCVWEKDLCHVNNYEIVADFVRSHQLSIVPGQSPDFVLSWTLPVVGLACCTVVFFLASQGSKRSTNCKIMYRYLAHTHCWVLFSCLGLCVFVAALASK